MLERLRGMIDELFYFPTEEEARENFPHLPGCVGNQALVSTKKVINSGLEDPRFRITMKSSFLECSSCGQILGFQPEKQQDINKSETKV